MIGSLLLNKYRASEKLTLLEYRFLTSLGNMNNFLKVFSRFSYLSWNRVLSASVCKRNFFCTCHVCNLNLTLSSQKNPSNCFHRKTLFPFTTIFYSVFILQTRMWSKSIVGVIYSNAFWCGIPFLWNQWIFS